MNTQKEGKKVEVNCIFKGNGANNYKKIGYFIIVSK